MAAVGALFLLRVSAEGSSADGCAQDVLSVGFYCWALAGSISCILFPSSGWSEDVMKEVGIWRC